MLPNGFLFVLHFVLQPFFFTIFRATVWYTVCSNSCVFLKSPLNSLLYNTFDRDGLFFSLFYFLFYRFSRCLFFGKFSFLFKVGFTVKTGQQFALE